MKIKLTTLTGSIRPLSRCFPAVAIMAMTLTALGSEAHATVVQTSYRTINAGSADFGSGHHSFGGPENNAAITYDWSTSTGQLVSTGVVRGTLYWDSLFSSGRARLTIKFKDANNADLLVRQISLDGPGGDANNSANQIAVNVGISNVNLFNIVLTVAEIRNGSEVNPVTVTITQVSEKNFPVTINNGKADFGDGDHHFGHPDDPGFISFRRNNDGTVTGGVDGILYYDAFDANSCARMVNDFRDVNNGILRRQTNTNCGPGGDANDPANQLFISDSVTNGFLSNIRINVVDTAATTNAVVQIFGFAGLVGDFSVEPTDAVATAGETIHYAFTWTVPEPLNWHDLDRLELRIADGSAAILHVRFAEAGNLISVFNEATGEFGNDYPAGTDKRLQTRYATLDLAETTVRPVNGALGTGPNSPTVRLDLALRFKPLAAGKTYRVEVAARDDFGNEDPFAVAGTLTVNR